MYDLWTSVELRKSVTILHVITCKAIIMSQTRSKHNTQIPKIVTGKYKKKEKLAQEQTKTMKLDLLNYTYPQDIESSPSSCV